MKVAADKKCLLLSGVQERNDIRKDLNPMTIYAAYISKTYIKLSVFLKKCIQSFRDIVIIFIITNDELNLIF